MPHGTRATRVHAVAARPITLGGRGKAIEGFRIFARVDTLGISPGKAWGGSGNGLKRKCRTGQPPCAIELPVYFFDTRRRLLGMG